MSLKQMIDAAEAQANVCRASEPGLSCTQDEPCRKKRGSEEGVLNGTGSTQGPACAPSLRGSATQELSDPGTQDLSHFENRSQRKPSR